MTHNLEKLKAEVLEWSESQEVEVARHEWQVAEVYYDDRGDTCSCSHRPIHKCILMKNKLNNNSLLVGSTCVMRFFGLNFERQFAQMASERQKEANRSNYVSILQEFEEMKRHPMVNKWEREEFIPSITDYLLTNNTLTPRQLARVEEIRTKIARGLTPEQKAEIESINFLKNKLLNDFERGFLQSVEDWVMSGRQPTDKQMVTWASIKNRYQVPISQTKVEENIQDLVRPELFLPLPSPFKWQLIAFTKWQQAKYNGTVKGATGIGKSMVGYMAIKYLKPNKTLIVVHTEGLMLQHKENLMKFLQVEESQIGLVGAGNVEFDKPITIAIVNSIRYEVLNGRHYDLLIMDEVHHYYADVNRTFLQAGTFAQILALSATPEREDGKHEEFLKDVPIIYTYTQKDAIDDKLLAPYKVINHGVTLTPNDEQEYMTYDGFIRAHPECGQMAKNYGMASVARSGGVGTAWVKAVSSRRQVIQKSPNKIKACINIVLDEADKGSKIIVFNEYIEAAQVEYDVLTRKGVKVGVYHSGLKLKERRQMLEDFKNNVFKILVSVKALDEGIDVPEADVAIIVGGSSSSRQQIQRIGRVLRKREGKQAIVYQVYVRSYNGYDSKDIDWVKKRMKELRHADVEWRIDDGGSL